MFHSRLPAAGYLTYVCEMEETNMKKKILKIIAAAAAVMSMSATAMAAGSIVGAIDMPGISASRGSDG